MTQLDRFPVSQAFSDFVLSVEVIKKRRLVVAVVLWTKEALQLRFCCFK